VEGRGRNDDVGKRITTSGLTMKLAGARFPLGCRFLWLVKTRTGREDFLPEASVDCRRGDSIVLQRGFSWATRRPARRRRAARELVCQ